MNTPKEINDVLTALAAVNDNIVVDGVVGPVCIETLAELSDGHLPLVGHANYDDVVNEIINALINAGFGTPKGFAPLVPDNHFGISSVAAAFYFVAHNFKPQHP